MATAKHIPEIVKHIPVGHENAIRRSDLARIMDVDDRTMRNKIADARALGFLIMNRQDGQGYYISDDIDEIARQYITERGRALTILAQLKTMEKQLKAEGRIVGRKVITEMEATELFDGISV